MRRTVSAGREGRAARLIAISTSALGISVVVSLASVLGIVSRPDSLLATFWPTNALLLGILVRRPRLARHLLVWLGAFLGYIAADLAFGDALQDTLVLTSANLVGVVAGYASARLLRVRETAFSHPMGVLRLFLVCVAASACAGLVGILAGRLLLDMPALDAFGYWVSAELVCYMSLLPVLLLAPTPAVVRGTLARPVAWARLHWHRLAPLLALLLSMAAASWMGGAGAIMLPIPALLWCALAYQLFSTALITLALSVWTLVAIGYGFMPLHSSLPLTQEIISLRVGVAFLVVAPLTVAVGNAARNRLLSALDHAASHDSLTRVLNRDAFFRRATAQLQALAEQARPATLILLDVDHFKRVNDQHGHAAGDMVLETFAARMQGAMRPGDLFGRFGGEEFIILLPDTPRDEAAALAERLRALTAATPITSGAGTALSITASLGCASVDLAGPAHSIELLLQAADVALYQAKSKGRDRVVHSHLG